MISFQDGYYGLHPTRLPGMKSSMRRVARRNGMPMIPDGGSFDRRRWPCVGRHANYSVPWTMDRSHLYTSPVLGIIDYRRRDDGMVLRPTRTVSNALPCRDYGIFYFDNVHGRQQHRHDNMPRRNPPPWRGRLEFVTNGTDGTG